ncbi:MAG: 3-deoxy-D-manno-octulosonic acid transferase [Beggiatoa sp. IS2]|nr:MAG: 3-deoxy-D-manno-octulosonic acid transferase [Beggiatoa sp. IS2]
MIGRFLYTVSLTLALPLILLRLLVRGFRAPAYWQRWGERLGFVPFTLSKCIWVHAVSVGEVQAAIPLIRALQQRFPNHSVLVTTITPTGSQRVQELFGTTVWHCYLPYDLPLAVSHFLKKVQPQILILMETELWPNLLQACHQRAIPVILANARLSARSMKGYQRVRSLIQAALANITVITAQSVADADRFLALGAQTATVQVTGNIKFDLQLPSDLSAQSHELRQQLGAVRPIWIAASTHEGEEELILDAFAQIKQQFPTVLLILVPRHPERFQRVATLCERRGYLVARRSQDAICTPTVAIYLGDTLGELLLFYAASDIAFVGGSLVPTGGHNMLEPAALGLTVIMGTYVFNFAEISQQLLANKAAVQIANAKQLAQVVLHFLEDHNLRQEIGKKAANFVDNNRGALARLLTIITEITH